MISKLYHVVPENLKTKKMFGESKKNLVSGKHGLKERFILKKLHFTPYDCYVRIICQ